MSNYMPSGAIVKWFSFCLRKMVTGEKTQVMEARAVDFLLGKHLPCRQGGRAVV